MECVPMTTSAISPLDVLNRLSDSKTSVSLDHLRQTHAQLIKDGRAQDSYAAGALVKLYASVHTSGLDAALRVFNQVSRPHVFLWNALIRASLHCGEPELCVSSYRAMLVHGSVPNRYTYPSLLNACAAVPGVAQREGRQVHAHLCKMGHGHDGHARSAGIKMYASGGMLGDARRMLLQPGGEPDSVCWNALLDGYMRCGDVEAARELFDAAPRRDVGAWNALVSGYARNGMIEEAREAFERMPRRDEVSWSAMVDAYVRCGRPGDALAVFRRMLIQNEDKEGAGGGSNKTRRLPKHLLPSVLAACADAAALEQGRWVHGLVKKERIPLDAVIGTALVDMYAKCGCVDVAREVFDEIPRHRKQVVSTWNALIGGLAAHGYAEEAMDYFSRMPTEGLRPDKVTFVNILTACAHAGLVDEGRAYFTSMERDHGLSPETEHYGCMVDLLGRAGLLAEAESMIHSMPQEPNAAVWGALLNACRIHRDAALAEKVGNILLELEPRNSGRYALLSNVFAKAGRWDDVSRVRKLMKDRGVRTVPGSSLVELDGEVHQFISGDSKHPRKGEVYSAVEEIMSRLAFEGSYVPRKEEVLLDVGEDDKEMALRFHSEKLALAFAFMGGIEPGGVIRIVKNLRVCEDCHSMMRAFSRVYGREVIMRDRVRYHRFRDGECSCKDYW